MWSVHIAPWRAYLVHRAINRVENRNNNSRIEKKNCWFYVGWCHPLSKMHAAAGRWPIGGVAGSRIPSMHLARSARRAHKTLPPPIVAGLDTMCCFGRRMTMRMQHDGGCIRRSSFHSNSRGKVGWRSICRFPSFSLSLLFVCFFFIPAPIYCIFRVACFHFVFVVYVVFIALSSMCPVAPINLKQINSYLSTVRYMCFCFRIT